MDNNIYDYISSFPGCKKTLEDQKAKRDRSYIGKCEDIMKKYLTDNSSDNYIICTTAMSYIDNLSRYKNEIPQNILCSYLYYWIYHELLKKGKSCDTKNLYQKFMSIYDYPGIHNPCKTYADNITSNDNFEKVKYLYETSLCLRTIEHDEEICEDNHFCATLKNIIKTYNDKNISELCECDKPERLSSMQTNTKANIIITILVTLVVLLLLFIFLKYTSFLTRLPYKLRRKISEFINKEEEMNMLHQHEDFNSISMNNGYNIVYNSE
ncbi:variable surface protein [Plasmodium gonderi]|uniref:Variable surface protein n=1 Tax=Plasmodium gonderi TaxID=77519 RepID=A0A1Y1JRG5_PLAGO|nr:variable surface protein [Plasmodium gonderi]GAW84085.1 variable surface protein [Plasmodium gonderi]